MIRAKLYTSQDSQQSDSMETIKRWRDSADELIWIDIEGELDGQELQLLQELGCHQLSLSDCQRKRHPPKFEEFDNNNFMLFRGIKSLDTDLSLTPQQIGLFVGERYLITVHRGESISIDEFWDNRIATYTPRPAFLAAQIMHYAAGRYLDVILNFEESLNTLEESLLGQEPETAMKELVSYRSRLLQMRRIFGYHEKLSRSLLEHYTDVDDSDLKHVVRDFYDRCERVHSLTSMYYDTCGDLIDGYISISSHQLNNTMRILTVITAVFIPLGFMAGLYGMNFDYIPELHFKHGYFVLLGAMFLIASTLIITFRRMKWL